MKKVKTTGGDLVIVDLQEESKLSGKYYVVGTLSSLKDEDVERYVEYSKKEGVYRNYIGLLEDAWDCGDSPLKSFISLLKSENIDVNQELLILESNGNNLHK